MICVFLAFVFGGQRVVGEFGVGLAGAVFIDAFILRTVLVPALMHLFGRANWWLPGWLDRCFRTCPLSRRRRSRRLRIALPHAVKEG